MKKTVLFLSLLFVGLFMGIYLERNTDFSKVANKLINKISARDEYQQDQLKRDSEQITDKTENKILYWVAPMDPNYHRDAPGKSPMGMDLIPVYENGDELSGEDSLPVIKISPEVVNNLGVRTTIVERGPMSREINTVGYLEYDETKISHIHTRTEGWIEKLTVRAEGERVKKGQLLFDIFSPDLQVAQEEYIHALNSDNKVLIDRTRQRLISLGISKKQIARFDKERKPTKNISFYAPQSGVLTKLSARDGMFVKPDTEIISLANLDSIWLLAEVFERQTNWVKTGQQSEATLPSMPGKIWEGKVEYIYPDLDAMTRTLRVRLRFDNPDYHLMPNMYAHIKIFSDKKEDVIKIPREALIREVDSARVIVALGNGRFQARQVVAGIESGDQIEIKSGLEEGEEIVVSSQFLIDSESSFQASMRRMQPNNENMQMESNQVKGDL